MKLPLEARKLHNYDLIIVNSSAGKDSLCALFEINRMAEEQQYPKDRIHVSHQDLGAMEWSGTKELAKRQADFFGFGFHVSKRRDKNGYEETLLEYVKRRKKWPSSKQRYCTSDFKRSPGSRVVTALTKDLGVCKVLHVFGFRADESPARSKKETFVKNDRLSTKKRTVYDCLPIHTWTTKQVWDTIKENGLPYHEAYNLGMPRLSCVFCIFSPFDALVTAGYANPELLNQYVQVESEIGHSFRKELSLAEVKEAIQKGYKPKEIQNWVM